ncbi:polyprenol monophosphomannose synthase [Corynebacterium yudongzhengii]|uniref:dolichyl-phosphate beta-D-mannosyltransferase n=1 Tax=Corynebacterium yudongzhengii TaxID=2080740 RepID=A0A2U1T8I0_9CORY|nr:polyprenol monophosphomannose synthase [Corynebacterium yudongzhengii]AWB81914.1 polyprenol monophosphomannose synthase [Corynebacterium yudongzhengii]PWC02306.1 polyprenol monophosphomannose synthase [Corynebacterium yudongzhengii]
MPHSTLVIVPTYDEIDNIGTITGRILAAQPEIDLLIVDDNSPDGTGEKADELAEANDNVHVFHRKEKDGLLGAYLAGFHWGLERDYEVFVQMDADGSHAPEQLQRLLDEIDDDADLVIGSRYVEGGEVVNWPKDRFVLSRGGNLYIGLALGTGLTDMTAGYRAYRREVLETIDIDTLSRAGYIFQVEAAFRAYQESFDVREVPITFTERQHGESKLDGSFVKDSLFEVTRWGVEHRTNQAVDMAQELGRFASYEFEHSRLNGLGRRLGIRLRNLGKFGGEVVRMANYEVQHSELARLLRQALKNR